MVLVDTNILLNASNGDAPQHVACFDALAKLRAADGVALAWPVVYEFLRVATHHVYPRPLSFAGAWAELTPLLGHPACVLLSETAKHAAVLERCAAEVPRLSGNLVHDFHLAVLMREHGVTDILTLDKGFRAFPWVTVRGL
jgi:toxin-antitoxin system PIN domain toxin